MTVFSRGIDLAPGGKKRAAKLSFRTVAKRVMGKFDWNMDLLKTLIPSVKGGDPRKSESSEEPSDEAMAKRLNALLETTTYTVYNYTRRGLFDKDKLIVSTLLTFSIMVKDALLEGDEYQALLKGLKSMRGTPCPDDLAVWMTDAPTVTAEPIR